MNQTTIDRPTPTRPPRAQQADIYLLLDAIASLRGALANVSTVSGFLLRVAAENPDEPIHVDMIMRYMQKLADDGATWDRCGRRTTDMYADYGHHGS